MNKSENLLDNLYVASPCSIPWESMKGDDTRRTCAGCSKTVYNISDMTKGEAEAFLRKNGTTQCMQIYRRADGTIMTDNCPRALRKIRDRYRQCARFVAGILTLVVSAPAAFGQGAFAPTRGEAVSTDTSQNTQNTRSKIRNPHLDGNAPRLDLYGAAGGLMPAPRVVPNRKPNKTHVDPAVITTVQKLPDGKSITVVQTHPNGKVIDVKKLNPNIERSAQGYYEVAHKYRLANNKEMAEFYYEKAIQEFDKQKNGDKRFRQHIQDMIDNLNGGPKRTERPIKVLKARPMAEELTADDLLPNKMSDEELRRRFMKNPDAEPVPNIKEY